MLTRDRMEAADLYRAHADELTAFATSMVGPGDAADAVSAAVISALGSASWAQVENHRAYLYRCVYNECLRVTKRAAMRRERELQVAQRPQRDVELPTLRPEIADAVRALSPQQRAVIALTYWHDMAIADVAEHLGISDGSVRQHLARARANLREVLDHE